MEARVSEIGGARPLTPVYSLVVRRLRQPLIDADLLPKSDIDRLLGRIEGSDFVALGPAIVAAWGRKRA